MTAAAEHTVQARPAAPPVSLNPYIGCLGVFLGAATTTLNGKLLSAGLPDLRGALGYSFDGVLSGSSLAGNMTIPNNASTFQANFTRSP